MKILVSLEEKLFEKWMKTFRITSNFDRCSLSGSGSKDIIGGDISEEAGDNNQFLNGIV